MTEVAGWYPDPWAAQPGILRLWDGTAWTAQVAAAGQFPPSPAGAPQFTVAVAAPAPAADSVPRADADPLHGLLPESAALAAAAFQDAAAQPWLAPTAASGPAHYLPPYAQAAYPQATYQQAAYPQATWPGATPGPWGQAPAIRPGRGWGNPALMLGIAFGLILALLLSVLAALNAASGTSAGPAAAQKAEVLASVGPGTDPGYPRAGNLGATAVDLQKFWARSLPLIRPGAVYTPVVTSRVVMMRPGTVGPTCERVTLTYAEVVGNAAAVNCAEGPAVVADATGILAKLQREFGPEAGAVVLAHEWGHVVQFEIGTHPVTVVAEQQADCYSGSYVADATSRGVLQDPPLDKMVSALMQLRDPPGIVGSADPGAHGTGFDRIRAFVEGFRLGVTECAAYTRENLPLVEARMNAADRSTGGNLPFRKSIQLASADLDVYFAQMADRHQIAVAPQHLRLVDAATGTCDGKAPDMTESPAVICGADGTELIDYPALQGLYSKLGDAAVMTTLVMDRGRTATNGDAKKSACLVGGWTRWMYLAGDGGVSPELRPSPGDLDKVVGAFRATDAAKKQQRAVFDDLVQVTIGFRGGPAVCSA